MGKTIYNTATSVDGFIADEHHSLDWLFSVEGGHADDAAAAEEPGPLDDFAQFMKGVGAIAMGASTYEWIYRHEGLAERPERWAYEQPSWVFSHRDLPPVAGADVRFVSGNVVEVHAAMVEAAGDGDRWIVGGGDLVGQFHDAGLLDEVIVSAAPVFLGGGAPLLPRRITADGLELVEVKRVGQFACSHYRIRK